MKVKNLNPYFGAACERHVVRGCGDESHLFGMLPPRAWTEAQQVFRRNGGDLPNGWLQEQLRPPKPEGPPNVVWEPPLPRIALVICVCSLVGLMVGFALGHASGKRARAPQPTTTTLHIGAASYAVEGPLHVVDAATGQEFTAPAGSSLALPDLE